MWRRKRTTAPEPVETLLEDPRPDVLAYVVLLSERDRARDIAVQLEQENAYLDGFLLWMRDELLSRGGVLLTIDDIVQAIDNARAGVPR
jgi:hypothetical protein